MISISKITVNNSAPRSTVIGALLAQNSSGNVIQCTFTLTADSSGVFAVSGNNLVTAWGTAPPLGCYSVTVRGANTTLNFSATAQFQVTVQLPPPTPIAIALSPASATVVDNSPAGTRVATASVTMSDGSQFSGTLTSSNPTIFAVSGLNIVTARALTPADDGARSAVITATQGSQSLSAQFQVTVQPAPPAPPVAEWTLTQASISGTTVADASGHGNTATVVNGPLTFGSMGANFNGTQYVDSTLAVNWPALTVSVWFNAANLSNANSRLVANAHTDSDVKGFQLMFNNGGGSGLFDVGNGTAVGNVSWSKQLVAGTWYHYVGVYDGATVSAYINGVQVATAPFTGGAIAAGTGPDINIGRNPTYGGDYFTGAVSDVRLYNRALPAAEILSLYQAVTPPQGAAPIAIALSPASTTVPDNSPAGTLVTTARVTMSDGSQFSGTLTSSNPAIFAVSGLNIVTARALTSADDGARSAVITATQGSQSLSMVLSL